eukprot:365455_1
MSFTKCRHERDHLYSVEWYCRDIFIQKQNVSYYIIPHEIVSIILSFYCSGKSFNMNVKLKNTNTTESVSYCPAYDNYNSICDKIQISFHKHVKDIHFANDILNSEIWEEFFREWCPDEIFTITPFAKDRHPFHRIRNKRFTTLEKLTDTLQGHQYSALDKHKGNTINQMVVLKETYKDLINRNRSLDGQQPFGTIENEIGILKYLSNQPDINKNFCKLIDVWETNDCIYTAMEFAETELFEYVSHHFQSKKKNAIMYQYVKKQAKQIQTPQSRNDAHIWLAQMQDVFRQLVECVHWIHSKFVVHLDLSLETCVVKVIGKCKLQVKITGFRCAKYYVCRSNEFIGKIGYISPEIYRTKRDKKYEYDTMKADTWSLGVMLFMMLVGVQPYKKPSRTDTCCQYLLNGHLESVLKHWKRLRLVSRDALDCMNKIFLDEKHRITMDELMSHPFVGLEDALEQIIYKNSHVYHETINDAISIYHNSYLSSESYLDKKCALEEIYHSRVTLLDAFNYILKCHAKHNACAKQILLPCDNNSIKSECKEMIINKNIKSIGIKNNIQLSLSSTENIVYDNKEDVKGKLIDQYRKKITDIYERKNPEKMCKVETWLKKYENNPHELYTKICKKYGITPDPESEQKTETMDDRFSAMHQILLQKLKNNSFADLIHSNVIVECFRDREKCREASDLYHIYGEVSKKLIEDDDYRMCIDIMNKMYLYFGYAFDFGYQLTDAETKHLTSNENTTPGVLTKLKQLLETKRCEILKSESGMVAYNVITNRKIKYVTTDNFLNEEKKCTEPTEPQSLKIFRLIKNKMEVIKFDINQIQNNQECSQKHDLLTSDCKTLLLGVLKEKYSIDIENDIDIEKLDKLLTVHNLNGSPFHAIDEEYFISNVITPCLRSKFDDIDSHRFGKRFRYWPRYSDNKTNDLINGFYYNNWYVHPKFNDIKDELLNNELSPLSVNQWNRVVLYSSKAIIRTNAMRTLRATVPINKKKNGHTSDSSFNKYGVKNNDKIRLEHLVPLLVYVNLDFVAKQLISTCNNNNYVTNKYTQWIKYMKRHSQLAHLARLIREAVECFGESMNNDKKLYHIIDESICLSSLNTRFYSTTSMTTSLNAAFIFNDSKANEIILELNSSNSSNLKYFDCSILSDYPHEFEHIVCGGMGTLQIVNIYDLYISSSYNYYIQAIKILIAAIENRVKEVTCFDNENEMKNVEMALNELINIKCKQDQNTQEIHCNQYIHNVFKQIC